MQVNILLWVCVYEVASVVSDALRPTGQQPARLLCPWDSPGKNTGVSCHALLQGIFPTQGSNPHVDGSCIGWQVLYHQRYLGSPNIPVNDLYSPPFAFLNSNYLPPSFIVVFALYYLKFFYNFSHMNYVLLLRITHIN